MKQLLTLLLCLTFALPAFSQSSAPTLQLKPDYSWKMLEAVQNLRKVQILLNAREEDEALNQPGLILSSSLIAIADYQRSNRDSKFAYLMRHPTSNNQIGKEVSEAVVHSGQIGLTAIVNDWMAAYTEVLYNPEQSFGAGTITSLERNQLQLRKGFVVLGNTAKFPLYAAVGKMDIPFAQTGSVSMFTNSTVWHAFGGLAYGGQLGFKKGGASVQLMLIQGGAQFRAAHTLVDSTDVPSRLNNFSLDANYTFSFGNSSSFQLGASYLHGSAYCQDYPVQHFNPCVQNNPAWGAYGKLQLGNSLTLQGSYNSTRDVWPGTHNPNPPLDVYPASKVSSMHAGLRYLLNPGSKYEYGLSAEYSDFRAGAKGAPWERQTQMVLGFSCQYQKASVLFVEAFATQGYAPLNFISGGNQPDPGETHSDADARSFGIVFGANVTL